MYGLDWYSAWCNVLILFTVDGYHDNFRKAVDGMRNTEGTDLDFKGRRHEKFFILENSVLQNLGLKSI